ncbi:MAG: NAD(P)-dependent oxidoreductase [Bacillota bacterium]
MEIHESRLGIVGMGAIGRKVAQVAGILGAQVAYYDIVRAPENVETELRVTFKPFDQLLAESDIVSIHVPLSERTRKMIGKREFELMSPGAVFVNTARGEVVDQAALAEALEGGRLAGAAIDALSPEPPPADNPLLNLSPLARDRLVVTPHLGGVTLGFFRRMLRNALENMARVIAGEPPKNVVNGVLEARNNRMT